MKIESTTKVVVRSDLYVAGITEDGGEFIAENYYVHIVFESGQTLNHACIFPGAEVEVSPDGFNFFADVRSEASDTAERLAQRIRNAGQINLDHWSAGPAAYGTDAYLTEVAMMSDAERRQ
tara:strand:+ start:121 stop:483 length:363 start_codon:yes stop_codon:yes gene_type:complete